jgi:tetratricopeptide (TPR) repeat protein
MTTAPRPQTDEAGPEPADAEGWALLDSLRRRLDDQGTQTRKTAAQVTQLADSIAALVDAQRRRSRWLNLNSFIAYLIFTLLCGGAFLLLYQNRARELVTARDRAAAERDSAAKRADDTTTKLAAREAADAKAWEAWQLLEAGKRDDAAKRLTELTTAPLSHFDREVLAARAKQAEMMQVDAALKAANAAFKSGRFSEVVVTLEGALTLQGAAPRVPEMHYLIGLAELKANEVDKAVTHFQAAVAADVGEEDARYQLASALDRAGQWAKARAEYDRFATAHPQSPSAVFAMRRSATLAHMPPEAPWVTAAAAQAAQQKAAPANIAPPPLPPPTDVPKPAPVAPNTPATGVKPAAPNVAPPIAPAPGVKPQAPPIAPAPGVKPPAPSAPAPSVTPIAPTNAKPPAPGVGQPPTAAPHPLAPAPKPVVPAKPQPKSDAADPTAP